VKRIAALLMLLVTFASLEFAQEKPIRIALTTSTTPASIPAIPTADISKDMAKICPNVILTQDASKADYGLEAVGGDRTNPHGQRLYKFTLFSHSGDVVFTTETRERRNAVKNVCAFIKK
jgi:hypothetical protein